MLQILSLEKDVILQSVPYPEFAKQMMYELNPDSQCVVFKAVARLALDPQALKGITAKHSQSNISTITDAAFTAMVGLFSRFVMASCLERARRSDACEYAHERSLSAGRLRDNFFLRQRIRSSVHNRQLLVLSQSVSSF